jgi:hypothetical protein
MGGCMNTTFLLGADDMPHCPKHGLRLVTEPHERDGVHYEVGGCPICDKTYTFEIEGDEA